MTATEGRADVLKLEVLTLEKQVLRLGQYRNRRTQVSVKAYSGLSS